MENIHMIEIKKNIQIFSRGIKTIKEIDKVLLHQQILMAIITGVYPFIGIYFTTRIINEIFGDKTPKKLFIYVILALLLSMLFLWFKEILEALIIVHQNQWDSKIELYFSKTNYEMKFIYLEDSNVKLLKNKIKTNHNATYAGLSMILILVSTIVTNLFSLITSVFFMYGIFDTINVKQSSEMFNILNSNLGTVVFVVFLIIFQLATVFYNNKRIKKEHAEWSKLPESNRLIAYYNEMLKDNIGAMDIRIYAQKNMIMKEIGKWTDNPIYIKNISKLNERYGRIILIINSMSQIIINIYIILKIYFKVYSIGYYIQYTAAIQSFTSSVINLIDVMSRLVINNEFLEDTFRYFDLPKEDIDDQNKQKIGGFGKSTVEFKNVSFKYPASEDFALQQLSLQLDTGKKYAIVGMNGSGKSTFIKLLCGLYKPQEGSVLLDGKNIERYTQKSYQNLFSAVFQDFNLFSFPLGQNISGNMEYNTEKAELCLQKVGFWKRYALMDKRLETPLYKVFSEEGIEISGGEAQKIAIARALYKDAPILIMDEPTSALDPEAEFEIYSRLNEMIDNKTVVFVSHRLSFCKFCDEIFVFDQGRLIQHGNHEELIENKLEKYYEMWNAQAQYYCD